MSLWHLKLRALFAILGAGSLTELRQVLWSVIGEIDQREVEGS